MTTHVPIVDATTLPLHLEHLFVGAGASPTGFNCFSVTGCIVSALVWLNDAT